MNQIFIEDVLSKVGPDQFWKTWAVTNECQICRVPGSGTKLYACWTVDSPRAGFTVTTTGYKGAVCDSELCQEMVILQCI
jgi:hypothetical protein